MKSSGINRIRAARALFALGTLLFAALLGLGYLGYLATRDPGFDWESPNVIEANEARRKFRLYETSYTNGQRGFVRLSQLEINSYLATLSTNRLDTNAPVPASNLRLRRLGVDLSQTNPVVNSWIEWRLLGLPAPFVVRRQYQISQSGTNEWELPLVSLQIGDLDIPRRYWPHVTAPLEPLDAPFLSRLAWTTNIQALLIKKDDVSQRQELRLYTYKPIPPEDLR